MNIYKIFFYNNSSLSLPIIPENMPEIIQGTKSLNKKLTKVLRLNFSKLF